MASHGHEVRIVAGRGQQVDEQVAFTSIPQVDSKNAEVLQLKSELDQGRLPAGFDEFSLRIERELAPLLVEADWLICHNVCSLNKNLALTVALRRISESGGRPRLILWHHDLAWSTPRYATELHDGYPWDLLRQDWPKVIQVVVSAQRQAELARLTGVDFGRIRVIPNGIDVAQFLGLGVRTEALVTAFHLQQLDPLILLPVRITPRKNIEFALRIVDALHSRFPDAGLLVTGPVGPHNEANAEYLRRLLVLRRELKLDESVVFGAEGSRESLPTETIDELYRLADAVLLPSYEEGFGLPLLEAGLAGVPVFCSEVPSLRELGGMDVTYFPPDGNAVAIAQAVASHLDASALYRLRRRIRRRYAWETIYASHLEPLLEGG